MAERRRLILRFLLIALGFAAASGVVAVLFTNDDTLIRVMATCLSAAAAAGLALPLTFLIERPRTSAAGLLAIGFIFVAFGLSLGMIWGDELGIVNNFEGRSAVSFFVVLMLAIPACLLLQLRGSKNGIWPGTSGLITTGVGGILFAIAAWAPGRWYSHDEWWGAGWSVFGVGLPIALCAIGGLTAVRPWRWVGVLTGAIAMLAGIMVARGHPGWDEELGLGLPLTLTLGFATVNLLSIAPLRPGQRWFQWTTIGLAIALTATVSVFMFDVGKTEWIGRLAAALSILLGCATLALIVLLAVNRRFRVGEAVIDVFLATTCPRCTAAVSLGAGRTRCGRCGLRFTLTMEQPLCTECGYNLYGAAGGVCPECGTKPGWTKRDGNEPAPAVS